MACVKGTTKEGVVTQLAFTFQTVYNTMFLCKDELVMFMLLR
jgi:hypothetical protein